MLYRDLFYNNDVLRTFCFKCPYKNVVHTSDITIGDFWGIEKWAADFGDTKGISLAILNTPNGEQIFEKIKESLDIRESAIEDCLQPCLKQSMPRPATRERFWHDFKTKPFEYVLAHYTYHYGWRIYTKKAVKRVLKALLPRPAIEALKKLGGR